MFGDGKTIVYSPLLELKLIVFSRLTGNCFTLGVIGSLFAFEVSLEVFVGSSFFGSTFVSLLLVVVSLFLEPVSVASAV